MLTRVARRRRRQAVRRPGSWWRVLLLVMLVAGARYFFFGDGKLVRLRQQRREVEEAGQQLEHLRAETDSLRHVLWQLMNDLHYVEKVAREEYGMSKPTERVYRIPLESDLLESD